MDVDCSSYVYFNPFMIYLSGASGLVPSAGARVRRDCLRVQDKDGASRTTIKGNCVRRTYVQCTVY